jgi:hypothetical protein
MGNINFIINSREKNKFNSAEKYFHYTFGLLLVILSLLVIIKSFRNNTIDHSVISNIFISSLGILLIVKGFISRDFMAIRKYISVNNDKISVKKPFKQEIQLLNDSIEIITIKPSNISFKTNETPTSARLHRVQ